MPDANKCIANITINFEDGTQSNLQYFAMIGLTDGNRYTVLNSPPLRSSKIKMNNYLAELSEKLIESIGI